MTVPVYLNQEQVLDRINKHHALRDLKVTAEDLARVELSVLPPHHDERFGNKRWLLADVDSWEQGNQPLEFAKDIKATRPSPDDPAWTPLEG